MLNELTIEELHELLVQKKITPFELAKEAIDLAKADTNNSFESILENEALDFASKLIEPEKDNYLWGIPFTCKDNIMTKGTINTGGSNILNDYVSPFDASVIKFLKEKKCILIAKTTLDELAMGGGGTTSHLGKTFNPYDKTHQYIIGGSSCGSAASVASGIVPFSLGTDTGDSIRKPACLAGLVGLKPTWGRISRYGVMSFASSLDTVGVLTRSVKDSALILDAISQLDNNNDFTASRILNKKSYSLINGSVKGKRIAVIKEIYDSINDECIRVSIDDTISKLQNVGVYVEYVSIDKKLLEAVKPVYFIISCAEATSNYACLDGIKYGYRTAEECSSYQEIMKKSRTYGFSENIKRRFIIGSYSLLEENQNEIFKMGQKARALITKEMNKILEDFDFIYTPCERKTRYLFDESITSSQTNDSSKMIIDSNLSIANLSGLPSIVVPIGIDEEGFPYGGNLMGKKFEETNLLNMAYALECQTNLCNLSIKRK